MINLLAGAQKENNLLRDFLAISTWQSFVSILLLFSIIIGFWFFLKYIKIKFVYRVLIGLGIGLVFGIVVQSIIGFPGGSWFTSGSGGWWAQTDAGNWMNLNNYFYLGDKIGDLEQVSGSRLFLWNQITSDAAGENFVFKDATGYASAVWKNEILWVNELSIWASLFKQVFINGILMLTIPVVFLAIFRVTSKPKVKGLGRITLKGVGILLLNVTIAFAITFWIGYALKVGKGLELDQQAQGTGSAVTKPIPQIIWEYVPSNFVAAFTTGLIIPVMVISALMGTSVKVLSKRQPEKMTNLRKAMDTGWDVIMSMLMTFMKIMPIAVISMILTSITTRPIGALKSIGLVLGIGYLSILIMMVLMTLSVMAFGVKIGPWWKSAWKPLVQGFATQSSNATLPISISTLKDEMKVNDNVVGVVAPLSTSMGLVACAGVQAGLVTSLLYTGSDNVAANYSLVAFFLMAWFTTVIASLGIAGVPGTSSVVTAGVLGGLGFGAYYASVYAIIGALDGLFDMGRTGANVIGGIQANTIVAASEGEFAPDSPLFSKARMNKLQERHRKIIEKDDLKEEKLKNQVLKRKASIELKAEAKKQKDALKHKEE
ncbi:proton/glutamate symporter [Spiroplasma sabaudiense Ar-1343]|uniref:L-cystine uptake protein TcyP n=1 Tax=Spiroplasma sabaudiense Ar-1343 TaxID=1276257 RepID=W6AIN0_9MOLU|nr:dicarboxylate/amino acid:cation symporter [Spiroplasma sabaudiense]AHI53564.1 proton/glutamate symporter [Spiroplasma sabaudiense Ar-1343]